MTPWPRQDSEAEPRLSPQGGSRCTEQRGGELVGRGGEGRAQRWDSTSAKVLGHHLADGTGCSKPTEGPSEEGTQVGALPSG